MPTSATAPQPTRGPFPAGGGEIGELIRSIDWSRTPIGPREGWSPALRGVVDLMGVNRFPMILWWGPRLVQLYNAPFRPILGEKHPRSLGQAASDCWAETWHVLGPLLETPLCGGPATWGEDLELQLRRHGVAEETHFTVAFSPVPDDTVEGGIGGVLGTVQEITGKVVGDRRRAAQGELGARCAEARTAEESCAIACQTLARYPRDVPFALLYLVDSDRRHARLAGTAGLSSDPAACPHEVPLEAAQTGASPWPLDRALRSGALEPVEDLASRLAGGVPPGPWNDAPRTAAIVPLQSSEAGAPAGFLVAGISARLQLDEAYRDFLRQVAAQVAGGIANARRYEAESGRAEQALRKSEERFRVLIEAASQAVWETDAQGRLVTDSPSWRAYTGQSLEELLQGGWLEAVHPDDRTRADREWRQALESGSALNTEFRLRSALGGWRWTNLRAAPMRRADGSVAEWVGMNLDITDRKRAEEAVRESESRQVFLLMLSDALRLFRNASDIQALACRVLAEHLGVERAWFLECDAARRLSLVQAEYAPPGEPSTLGEHDLSFCTETSSALSRGQPFFVRDVEGAAHVSPETRELCRSHCVRAYGALPLLKDGELKRTLVVASRRPRVWTDDDVALVAEVAERSWAAIERGRAEEELRRSQAQLEEADRRKDHFLAVLSHELRNPLTPVKNSLYVLDRVPPGSEQARRALAIIGRQVDQLAHLVDELLDVTRITRGKVQLQRRRLELSDLVRRTVEDHRGLFERSRLELSVRAVAGPVLVDADPHRVAQIVGNLLLNAAKFTPAGGRVEIEVSAPGEGTAALVKVRDSGVGLDASMLGRLFEPFMQADASLDRSKGGLGLGLALVKGMVELHGGTVEARSPGPGQGAEFTVRLPLAAPVAEPAGKPAPVGPDAARRRVLIIEDNADAAESLREVLALCGHEVAVAGDGVQGLARARAFRPELVLCDIGLPGMDGYAVARAFRADEALKGVRLVALSGYAQPEDMERAAEAGFEKHLAKPPDLQALEKLLSEAPRRKESTAGGVGPSGRAR